MIATVAEGPTIDRIEADYRSAFKRGDAPVVGVLRMVKAAVKNASIAKRGPLDESEVMKVLSKEMKQRRDSVAAYTAGGRADLAATEQAEITLLSAYLPEPLNEAQLEAVLDRVLSELKPAGPKDFGRVMGRVMQETAGRADGAMVQQKLNGRLAALGGT